MQFRELERYELSSYDLLATGSAEERGRLEDPHYHYRLEYVELTAVALHINEQARQGVPEPPFQRSTRLVDGLGRVL